MADSIEDVVDRVLATAHPRLRERCCGPRVVETIAALGAYDAADLRVLLENVPCYRRLEAQLEEADMAPPTFLALLAKALAAPSDDTVLPSPPAEASAQWLHGLHLIDLLAAARVSRAWQAHARNPVLWQHLTLVTPCGARKNKGQPVGLECNLPYYWYGGASRRSLSHNLIGDAQVRRLIGYAQGQLRTVTVSGLDRCTQVAFVGLEQHRLLESVSITFCPRIRASIVSQLELLPHLKEIRLFGCQLVPSVSVGDEFTSTEDAGVIIGHARTVLHNRLEALHSHAEVDVAICSSCTTLGTQSVGEFGMHAQECVALRSSFRSCSKCHKVGCTKAAHAWSSLYNQSSRTHKGCDTSRECKTCQGKTRPGPDVLQGGGLLCQECDNRLECELCRGVVCDGCRVLPNNGGPSGEIAGCPQCGRTACRDCRDDDACTSCHQVLCNVCKSERIGCATCGKWLCDTCIDAHNFDSSDCAGCGRPVCNDCNIYQPGARCACDEGARIEGSDDYKTMCHACERHHPTKCSGCGTTVCKDCAEECGSCHRHWYCQDCAPAGGSHLPAGAQWSGCDFEPMRHDAAVRLGLPTPRRCDFCSELHCPECQPSRDQGGRFDHPMLECDTCSRTSCGECAAIVSCDCCGSNVCRDEDANYAVECPHVNCGELSWVRPLDKGRTEGRPICCDVAKGVERGPAFWAEESESEDSDAAEEAAPAEEEEEEEEEEEDEDEDEDCRSRGPDNDSDCEAELMPADVAHIFERPLWPPE